MEIIGGIKIFWYTDKNTNRSIKDQTLGKQFWRQSGGVRSKPWNKPSLSPVEFTSQFQKHSSLPPVVIPHMGSLSSLYRGCGVGNESTKNSSKLSNFNIYEPILFKTVSTLNGSHNHGRIILDSFTDNGMGGTHEHWNNCREKCGVQNDFHILPFSFSLSLSPSYPLPIPSFHLFDVGPTFPSLRIWQVALSNGWKFWLR